MESDKIIHRKYKPLIISGCSGVGKGTLIKNLVSTFPQLFQLSASFTTRKPRAGQTNGIDYHFVDKNQFQKLLKGSEFLQNCIVHNEHYGTSSNIVNSIIKKGKICILDIDIQGAEKIQKVNPSWNYLFITPPNLEELELRIRGRGTQTEQSIKTRISNASKELKRLQEVKFYETLLNDNIQDCFKRFIQLINKKYELLIEVEK